MTAMLFEKAAGRMLSKRLPESPQPRQKRRWPWVLAVLLCAAIILRTVVHKSLFWALASLLGLAGLHVHSPLHVTRTISLDRLVRIGIEEHNIQLRGNPLDYRFSVRQDEYLKTPWKWTDTVSKGLHHKKVTLTGTGGVARLVNPEGTHFVARVNDQQHSLTLVLPEPTIDGKGVSINQINGTHVDVGLGDALIGSQLAMVKNIFGFDDSLDLKKLTAEAKGQMLAKARTDTKLLQSSERDIQFALGAFITATPAYHGYRFTVAWQSS
jgi:hypothetical protein